MLVVHNLVNFLNSIAALCNRMEFFVVVHVDGLHLVIFALGFCFFFGHIWHGARTIFRDVFAGIDPDLDDQVEFGAFQKLGDLSTRRQSILILFS